MFDILLQILEWSWDKVQPIGSEYDGGDAESHEKFSIFAGTSRALGKATLRTLSIDEWEQAHLYMLNKQMSPGVAPLVR